ncbi:MAG: patatin-like phospholipase family protein [Salinivirgaceae bacterium]|nr:patatin-like phospholipase family protein [Salinivirgaceae bacterium]
MKIQSIKKRIVFLLICLFSLNSASAQSVGLVLSGGGAKGIAHIGVIRALEENNIPIDYVGGTSIGAIVGALYAIGFSPDEMEELLTSEDFEKWIYGYIDIKEEYYYKLKDESASWIEIPLAKIDGDIIPQLPTNIISPEQMDLRFMQYMEPANAAANYNFEDLMVPFFCIATDVHKNKPVILSKGSLSSSVRSSMTFPGYFKPIIIDSTLLFDGGMENNFPTDIMINKFAPDILIGSKVASNPSKPNAEDIYEQLENVFMKYTNYSMPKNGILIEPQVSEYGFLDFKEFDTLSNRGYRAAIEKIDSIKKMITRRIDTNQVNQKRAAFKCSYKNFVFENIYITGVNDETVDYILKNIRRNRSQLSFEDFEKEYFKLLSDKLIKSIYPHTTFNPLTNTFDLYLDIRIQNEFSVELGGNISSNVRNMGYAGIDYVFQKKNIYNLSGNFIIGKFYNSIHGKFRMDFPPRNLSKDKTLSPFYIDISAANNNWNFFTTTSDWFVDKESPTKVEQSESHFQSNFGRPLYNRGLFYSGFSYGRLTDNYFYTNIVEQKDVTDETIFNYSSVHATYEYSTLNYKEYANKGRFVQFQARYITGQEIYTPGTTSIPFNSKELSTGHSWYHLSYSHTKYWNLTKTFTIGGRFDATYTNKSSFSNSMATLLNAYTYQPFPQSKVFFLEKFRAHSYAAIGAIPIFHLNERIDFRGEVYAFQPYKYISIKTFTPSYSKAFSTPSAMASLGAIFHTPLGPLALTASYFMNEETNFYYQLNFGYLLFNKRGID